MHVAAEVELVVVLLLFIDEEDDDAVDVVVVSFGGCLFSPSSLLLSFSSSSSLFLSVADTADGEDISNLRRLFCDMAEEYVCIEFVIHSLLSCP